MMQLGLGLCQELLRLIEEHSLSCEDGPHLSSRNVAVQLLTTVLAGICRNTPSSLEQDLVLRKWKV